MKPIIFGGTGFLGSHGVEALCAQGQDVLAATRSARGGALLRELGATPAKLDFADDRAIAKLCAGRDVALFCVADPRLHQPLKAMREVEVDLTRRLVRIAAAAGVRRVVQLSSVQVYGFERPAYAIDEDYPGTPSHDFNQVCMEREEAVWAEAKAQGIEVVMLRPTNAFGRRDRSFMPPVLSAHRRGFYVFMGNPDTPFSGIDARDVGSVLAWATASPAAANQTFLAKGFDTTWAAVKRALDRAIGRSARSIVIPKNVAHWIATLIQKLAPKGAGIPLTPMAVDVTSMPTLFDDSRIRGLGWAPRYCLSDAVSDALTARHKR